MDKDALKRDYATGKLSLRALAEKHGVPRSTIAEWAQKEQWPRTAKTSGQAVQRVRTEGRPSDRTSAGGQTNLTTGQLKDNPKTKPIRGSRHAPPTNAFSKRNTLSFRHGGYSRRLRLPEDVQDDIREMKLRDELNAIRGANLLVADDVGRLRGLLKLERDPKLKAVLQDELRQAENALHRNIARIESLERSVVYVEHAGVKMDAETERTAAQAEKTRLELEIMGKQLQARPTLLGEIIAKIQSMEHDGLLSNIPDEE